MTYAAPSERTRVRRLPQRADYDPQIISEILDQGLVAHLGFAIEGRPVVIPTTYVRIGEELFVHGSPKSGMLLAAATGTPLCVTVTLLDGLVLARSAFHHSMNYRSVVVYGEARVVDDAAEKRTVLTRLVDRFVRGRAEDVRGPNERELKATAVVAIPLLEASAKIRSGPPLDDVEDLTVPCWAGVLPLHVSIGDPVPDVGVPSELEAPAVTATLLLARTEQAK
jgi:nitroimidazol reductase NimA-like FMN-containing flavoprotein (pyridoxamine 5'-phosphate oxidase superfamily)